MKSVAYRLIAVASIAIVLTAATDVFLTSANILNVLRQASLTFLIASGLTLTILTAGLDLIQIVGIHNRGGTEDLNFGLWKLEPQELASTLCEPLGAVKDRFAI